MKPTYLSARTPAQRLAILRATNPEDWRKARRYGFHNWAWSHGAELNQGHNNDRGPVWATHAGQYFRSETDSKDYMRNALGYYTDGFQSDVARGIVAALPHGRFIGGYEWTSNGERVWFPELFDNAEDAAQSGDNEARIFAEREREYQEQWQEARQEQDIVDDRQQVMCDLRETMHEVVKAIREARDLGAHINAQRACRDAMSIREKFSEALDELLQARAALAGWSRRGIEV